MNEIKIKGDMINLSQFLKLESYISSGGEVVYFMETNKILINDEPAFAKRQKIYNNFSIQINDVIYKVISEDK